MTDDEFILAFERLSIVQAEWTHRAHVKVAFIYLRRHPFDEALAKMRAGVKALNARLGVPECPTSGYNETTTHAFMHLIAATMGAYEELYPAPSSESFCELHPQLMTRHALRLFYSPERRSDPRAKTQFLPPDLAPLPRIRAGASQK